MNSAETSNAGRRPWLRWLFGLPLAALAAYFAVRGLDLAGLQQVMRRAEPTHLALAFPLLAISYAIRGLRWHGLFPKAVRAHGLRHAGGILLIGFLINNILPARGGELVRVVLMGRHNKVPASGTLATLFAERVFDGFALGVLSLLALPALLGRELRFIQQLAILFSALFALLLAAAFYHRPVARLIERGAARFPGHLSLAASRSLVSALGYLGSLASPVTLLRTLLLTLLVWGFEAGAYACVARAFGVVLSPAQVGGFLSVANFASLAPTPGGLGVVELAGTLALSESGIARESAFAIVTAQHLLQYTFCLLFGGWFAGHLGFTWGSKVVAPFRSLCDLPRMLATPAAGSGQLVQKLRAAQAGHGPQLSVVVPAYNEEPRILPTLLAMLEYLEGAAASYEIIVVDDGSRDATADVVHQLSRRTAGVRLLCLPSNLGKGAAVRAGMRSAAGELLLFADADGATPIAELDRLLSAVEGGADIAIASRALHSADTTVARTTRRWLVGRAFAFLVNSWAVPGIADTQCGFKLFRRGAAKRIFDLQQLDGFAFDVELLKLAKVLDYRVAEVAVNWADRDGSKVSIATDSLRMLWDVLRIPYLPSVARATGALTSLGNQDRAQP